MDRTTSNANCPTSSAATTGRADRGRLEMRCLTGGAVLLRLLLGGLRVNDAEQNATAAELLFRQGPKAVGLLLPEVTDRTKPGSTGPGCWASSSGSALSRRRPPFCGCRRWRWWRKTPACGRPWQNSSARCPRGAGR